MTVDTKGVVKAAKPPKELGEPSRLRQAVVLATKSNPNRIDICFGNCPSTATVPDVRYLSSYSPSVGHTVWVMANGPDYIVLGRLA